MTIPAVIPYIPRWRCEACGRLRPDAHIAVYSRDVSDGFGLPAGMAHRNVCYCVDSPSCRARSVEIVDAFEAHIRKDMDA